MATGKIDYSTLLAYINALGIKLYNTDHIRCNFGNDELLGKGSAMRVYSGLLIQDPTAPPIPVALKVPDLDVHLRTQVSRFVAGLRKLELRKAPSIAETLDWARGLCALGVRELDSAMVRQTLSLVLKHEEDLRKAEGKLGALLAGATGRASAPA